ncbi:MAG: hypothetical protein ABIP13_11675 [Tepidiformaceae bacterium]
MEEIVELLGAVEVLTPTSEKTELGSAWSDQPVLLAMIRHFG